MNVQDEANQINPKMSECMRTSKCWPWFLVLGIIIMVVGAMAIGVACLATLTTVLVFGIFLIAGGIVQIVNAFLVRNWRGFLLHLLAGVLQIVLGMIMIDHPERTAAILTLLLAVAFMAGGLLRIVYAIVEDFVGRGWVLLNGLVTLVLGVMIWRQWPEASLWVIGLFVGIDLVFEGWSWVMLGLFLKSMGKAATSPQPMQRA